MKKKSFHPLIRLFVIVCVIIISFWILVYIAENFGQSRHSKLLERQNSFGILLPRRYHVHGIDVSRHQENIDWKRVENMRSAGERICFAFIKATEGITRQDPFFERNWENIAKTSFIRGAYHFYYPSRDAEEQANNFIAQVSLIKGDLPPVADIEHTNGKNSKEICAGLSIFLKSLEKHYKVRPIIYTNLSFYNKYLIGKFDEYPLWISYYNTEEMLHTLCNQKWTFWQHSEKGRVDGIAGKVDFNVFDGNELEINNLCLK